MKLLILGGTRFLGRHLVAAALARNHEVTLFNRGQHPAPSGVETIQGDRKQELNKLQGRHWDAVIDTCGYLPRDVKAASEFLEDSVNRYVFISSVSVYADFSIFGIDETSPLASITKEQLDQANELDSSGQISAVIYGKMYGPLKAFCEAAAEEGMPNRVLIVRPGLIVGPDDYTDRFTYWPVRVARGGEVLAPSPPGKYLQFIDARDLAQWCVHMVERQETGVYNANGLSEKVTMESMLEDCKSVSASDASFTWSSEDFLLQEKVMAWSELPLWLPEDAAPHMKGFMFINSDKALATGLTFRQLADTIRDTLDWYETSHGGEELKAGLDANKERAVLRKWHEMLSK